MWSFADSVSLPEWSDNLRNLYWHIRAQGRNDAMRMKYYRKVQKEKLRLAEMGVSQVKIAAVCRYLSNFKNSKNLRIILAEIEPQLAFNFFAN